MREATMRHHLSTVLAQARKEAGRKQIHIAAALDVNQSTVDRFEKGKGQPKDLDAVVAAYADDLGIPAVDLWERALERWRAGSNGSIG